MCIPYRPVGQCKCSFGKDQLTLNGESNFSGVFQVHYLIYLNIINPTVVCWIWLSLFFVWFVYTLPYRQIISMQTLRYQWKRTGSNCYSIHACFYIHSYNAAMLL